MSAENSDRPAFEGWAILELMGHRKLGGRLSEAVVGGAAFIRIDVAAEDGQPPATQFYAPAAVYCITPCTEETARALARGIRPAPVNRYELLPAKAAERVVDTPAEEVCDHGIPESQNCDVCDIEPLRDYGEDDL
jgi:hypothetical protein